MEALSCKMLAIVNEGFITGFSVGARNDDLVSVSHVAFLLKIPSFSVGPFQITFNIEMCSPLF